MINYQKLLELLEEKGYSQSYISTKMGMSRGYLRDCIKNNTDIPKERLMLVCGMLDTTPSYLCDEEENQMEQEWILMNEARNEYHYRLSRYVSSVASSLDDRKEAMKLYDMLSKMTTTQLLEFEEYINKLIKGDE